MWAERKRVGNVEDPGSNRRSSLGNRQASLEEVGHLLSKEQKLAELVATCIQHPEREQLTPDLFEVLEYVQKLEADHEVPHALQETVAHVHAGDSNARARSTDERFHPCHATDVSIRVMRR